MWEAIEVMRRVREAPDLDAQVRLFSEFLQSEFKYDGFVYGVALDPSSIQSTLETFLMKAEGMNVEWMEQYTSEGLALKDLTIAHLAQRTGVLHQTKIFEAVDNGRVPDDFSEVANRVRDYINGGITLSMHSRGLVGGAGLHTHSLTQKNHDIQFAKYGHIVIELCRQFHDVVSWHQESIRQMGLSEANLQVLRLKSQGLLDKQIIEITGHRHENSVAQHMTRIATKLRTKNDRQTIAKAAALGLLGDQHLNDLNFANIEENGKLVAKKEGWLGEIV